MEAFREGGGGGKPLLAQAKVAWGPDESALREDALRQWGTNLFEGDAPWYLRTPKQFEQAAAFVRAEDLDTGVTVSADLARHAARLREYAEASADESTVHNVASNHRAFIGAFGAQVLRQLA